MKSMYVFCSMFRSLTHSWRRCVWSVYWCSWWWRGSISTWRSPHSVGLYSHWSRSGTNTGPVSSWMSLSSMRTSCLSAKIQKNKCWQILHVLHLNYWNYLLSLSNCTFKEGVGKKAKYISLITLVQILCLWNSIWRLPTFSQENLWRVSSPNSSCWNHRANMLVNAFT